MNSCEMRVMQLIVIFWLFMKLKYLLGIMFLTQNRNIFSIDVLLNEFGVSGIVHVVWICVSIYISFKCDWLIKRQNREPLNHYKATHIYCEIKVCNLIEAKIKSQEISLCTSLLDDRMFYTVFKLLFECLLVWTVG